MALRDTVRSCQSCLAWGVLSGPSLCAACYLFGRSYDAGECTGCGRVQPIRKQFCRSCWCQARAQAREPGVPAH
jgi:hypothetical protein